MIGGQEEITYNEDKARYLVDYLLEDDIPVFKKLRKEIRTMDSHSFINLFQGVRFKNPQNANGFEYKVKNKKSFQELLEKFDNFYDIIESWYLDESYYKYIKDLWLNYISIKDLVEMNENAREELLKSYDIDYKNWPENVKQEFIRIIRLSKNKKIFTEKREKEISEIHNEFKRVLKEMYEFKAKIETEPEMETYEKNTDKFIDTIKSILKPAQKLFQGKSGKLLSLLGIIPTAGAFMLNGKTIDIPTETKDDYDYDYDDDYDYEDDLVQSSENSKEEEMLKNFWENPNLQLYIYSALSFIHLGWSVWEFKNAYQDLTQIKKNIVEYDQTLKEIEKQFNEHKEKIGILPDNFIEALKIISEVFKEIGKDYSELQDLINKINKDIEIAQKHKDNSTFGLIGSTLLGVGGFLITKNPSSLYNISLTLNVVTGIGHTAVIVDSNITIGKLKNIKIKAEKQKEIIKAEINNLIKLLLKLEKGLLPHSNVNFKVKLEEKLNEKKRKIKEK